MTSIILRLLLYKDIYNKYIHKIHAKELLKYINTIKTLHEVTAHNIEFNEFKSAILLEHPDSTEVIKQIDPSEISLEIANKLMQDWFTRDWANKLALKAIDVTEGRASLVDIQEYWNSFTEDTNSKEDEFVTNNFEELWEVNRRDGGIEWFLPSLNKSIGGLRICDFGIIFARTNIGKTSFNCNQIAYILKNTKESVLYFNNEEAGGRVYFRIVEAYFGIDREKLGENLKKAETRFKEETQDRLKIFDMATISKYDIERVVKSVKPGIILVDNLDKIKGFKGDRQDIMLGSIYTWAREIAKQYAPFIGVSQAADSASNKKWLDTGDMADSNTSKQKELDFLIGIGATTNIGEENIRYLSICKNKFNSFPNKITCRFDSKTSRFKEM